MTDDNWSQRDYLLARDPNILSEFTDDDIISEIVKRGYEVALTDPEFGLTVVKPPTVTAQPVTQFDEFWAQYPRKVGKKAAYKVWSKMTQEERDLACNTIDLHTQMWFAEGRGLRTVPHASTWLNGERWDDEVAFIPERDPNSKAARSKAAIQRAVATNEPKALWS